MGTQAVQGNLDASAEHRGTVEALRRKASLGHILGGSRAMQEVRRQIELFSSCKVTVLICGETGTGKELAARAIHYLSNRAGGPFVPVNCGAIPENLFENELFGHVRGAFTDARHLQVGLVQQAERGTLFLDEIGALSPCNQVKLLRLLQDSEYKRLGDPLPRRAEVRIVAATNKDLLILVKEGIFREDLYYRLDVASLRMPPLRERTEDIPLLIEWFLRRYSAELGKVVEGVSCSAMSRLLQYPWPGNVRELESKVQSMILTASGPSIDIHDVHLPQAGTPEWSECDGFADAKRRVIKSFERDYLTQLLTWHRGNVPRAARQAGKSRTGLWNLIRRHGLSPKDFVSRGLVERP